MGLTEGQKRVFHEKGFVVKKGFFDAKTMEQVSEWLTDLSRRDPADGQEAKYYEKSALTGENVLVRVENILGDNNPEIGKILISDEAIACLTDLFDEAPVLFKEKVNYKVPGCRADKLHQDQAAGWNAFGDFFITMGIVVDEIRKENAALSFLASGNYEKKLMTEEWKALSEDDPPYQPEDEYLLLEADPGDVVFFDCYVPHGSPPNTSNRDRRVIFLTFNKQSDGDLRDRYYREKWKSYPPNQASDARAHDTYRV